jgi:RNA recognition motif-containing protein
MPKGVKVSILSYSIPTKAVEKNNTKVDGVKIGVSLVRKKLPTVKPGEKTIFIKNLPYSASEEVLRKVFKPCGEIEWVNVPVFEDSRKPKGFAFMTFASWHGTREAVKMNRKNIGGREILIEVAKEKEEENQVVDKKQKSNEKGKLNQKQKEKTNRINSKGKRKGK